MNFATPGHDYCAVHGGANKTTRPKVVTLCGSTRFCDTFDEVGLELTKVGVIVLSIGTCRPDARVLANPDTPEGKRQKALLDWLHKKKIDLSDEILVLNVDGYIGDSTRSEIMHAEEHGVPVKWLYPKARSPHPYISQKYDSRCVCCLPEMSPIHALK